MEWHGEARRLRAEGLTIRQIAVRVGKANSTVGVLFKPRTHCAECGAPMMSNPTRCLLCVKAEQRKRAAEFAALYNQGVPLKEIAARMGYADHHTLGAALDRRKKEGLITASRYRPRAGG